MTITFTLTVMQIYTACFFSFIAVLFYIYTKDDGDDHLTHIRHDIEMKKEWFKMLAERNKNVIR
jgi:uncharacterized membrane protein